MACESRLSFFDVFYCYIKKKILLVYSNGMRVHLSIAIQELDDFCNM